jgi:hypothetical protein
MTEDILISAVVAIILGMFPAIWAIRALSEHHKFTMRHFFGYGATFLATTCVVVFMVVLLYEWRIVDVKRGNLPLPSPVRPEAPKPLPPVSPPAPEEQVVCNAASGPLASDLCAEIRNLKNWNLTTCFNLNSSDYVEIDIEETPHSNAFDALPPPLPHGDFVIRALVHRSSKVEPADHFTLYDSPVSLAKADLVERLCPSISP